MNTHTPGPWHVVDVPGEASHIVGANNFTVVRQGYVSAMDAANARLIAAAPDLLAALKALIEDYEGACGDDGSDTPTALIQARVAIAKATHADTNKIAAIAKAEGMS